MQCLFGSFNWQAGNASAPRPPCPDAPLPDLAALQAAASSAGQTGGGATPSSGDGGTSSGAIAGIAVGAAAAVAAAAAAGFVVLRRRRRRRQQALGGKALEGVGVDASGTGGSKLCDSREALQDPLLSYINTHLKGWASHESSSGGSRLSRPSSLSPRGSGGVDVAPWVSRGWRRCCCIRALVAHVLCTAAAPQQHPTPWLIRRPIVPERRAHLATLTEPRLRCRSSSLRS